MMYLFGVYSLPSLITILLAGFSLTLLLSRGAWGNHITRLLVLWLSAGLLWNAAALMESMAIARDVKIFWAKFEFIGGTISPPLMLLFALRFTHFTRRLLPWLVTLLFLPSLIFMLLAVTNHWHFLMWTGFEAGPAGTNSLIYQHGPAFYSMFVAMCLSAGLATLLFARNIFRTWRVFRLQSLILLGAVLFCWACLLVYLFGNRIIAGPEIMPLGLSGSAVLISLGMVRLQLFDLYPVARDQVLEQLQDGVIVTDHKQRLVDINQSARQSLQSKTRLEIGELFRLPESWREDWESTGGHTGDFPLVSNDGEHRWYELSRRMLQSCGGNHWTVLVMRDVTARKQADDRLREQYQRILELEASLREQAFRDSLTGLHNRRYLDEAVKREVLRAKRENAILSILMLDLDHFKAINDHYGHAVGDRVLIGVGGLLKSFFRDSDITCRFGGEEFVVVLWGSGAEAARQKADQLREALAEMDLCLSLPSPPTVSVGVAAFPEHGESPEVLLKLADQALYQAKEGGRDRVMLATIPR